MKAKKFIQHDKHGFTDHAATGLKLRQFRESQRIPLTEMARRLDVDKSVVSRLETGQIEWTPRWVERFLDGCKS